MKKICIFQDSENMGRTVDLLDVARRMYGQGQFESHAVILDNSFSHLHGFFHRMICLSENLVKRYDPRGICDVLENLHQRNIFDTVLIPATNLGKMVAPRLSRRMGAGLVSGVTDIKREGDTIEIIRPAYSGKLLEKVHYKGRGQLIMSIRLNAFEYRSGGKLQTEVCEYTGPVSSCKGIKRLHVEKKRQICDIMDSEVLISGGGGVKGYFHELYRLADALNGTVAASRSLVDQGVAPRSIQVGQSGKTVSPRLYMALGIHGSMQHIAGLRDIESIISINTAYNAPICSLSDMVVQGDAGEFIERLVKRISIYRSEKKDN